MDAKKPYRKIKVALLVAFSIFLYQKALATVSNQNTKTICAIGNNATTSYTIGFQFQDNSEVQVYLQNESVSPYTRTRLVYGAGAGKYQITGGDPGTTVVLGTAPTTSQRCLLVRSTPKTQTVDYEGTEAFPADDHEEQMDRFAQLIQEDAAAIGLKIGLSTLTTQPTPTFPEPSADKFIVYNHAGDDLTLAPSSTSTLASGDVLKYNGSAWRTYNLDAVLGLTGGLVTPANGGTGADLSSASGILRSTSGAFSAGKVNNADIGTAIDYGHLNLGGSVVNADVASAAAITRTKLANGTASHVVVNDGSGIISSVASIAITQGGTGQATSTLAFNALSPLGASGDMIIHDGSNNIKLPIGTQSQIMTVDTTQQGKIKWATPASTAKISFLAFVSGSDFNIADNNPGTILIPNAKAFDTNNAFNTATGQYTAPKTMKMNCYGGAESSAAGGWNANETWQSRIYVGTVLTKVIGASRASATFTGNLAAYGAATVDLVGGSTVELRIFQNSGATLAASAGLEESYFGCDEI